MLVQSHRRSEPFEPGQTFLLPDSKADGIQVLTDPVSQPDRERPFDSRFPSTNRLFPRSCKRSRQKLERGLTAREERACAHKSPKQTPNEDRKESLDSSRLVIVES
ncbi:hypothetical protein chiPu_0020414 [Chiloscyllium punctatum]|uniref:Uncharacterized protein n=1 Tax=Chiloscyllium punctatum TaxID=137246 RepID=A0A401RFE2_CHIPU|nr:hypothetical protein [Chiloscyllium punctatum]